MTSQEQAEHMINRHGSNALTEHDKIMENIRNIYKGDHEKALKESQSYPHLVDVRGIIFDHVKKTEWHHIKSRAKQWFGMELMEDNFEHFRELVRSVEYDKSGKKRSRQQIRAIVRTL